MKALRFFSCLILLMPVLSFAETHPDVNAALNYQIPENACRTKPKSFESSGEAIGKPVQASGALNVLKDPEQKKCQMSTAIRVNDKREN